MALSLDSKIKDILRSPEGRAVMEKWAPGSTSNPSMKLVGALMRAFPLLLIAALLPTGVGLSAPASFGALMLSLLSLLLGLVAVTAVQHQRRAGAGHAGQPRSKRGHHLFDPVSVRQYPPADALSRPLAALHSMAALRADFGRAHSPVHR